MNVRAGWVYFALVACLLGAATFVRAADPFFLQALRLIAFDSYQRLEPQAFDPAIPVRIVDIDEDSLAKIGQWPWPRTTIAHLLDTLKAQGAAVVAFDILFAQPDRTSPEQLVKYMTPEEATAFQPLIAGVKSHDATFADAIGNDPTVLATALTHRPANAPLPAKAGFAVAGDDPHPFINAFTGSDRNLPELDDKAAGIGAINWIPDRDQVVRRVSVVYGLGDTFVPSLFAEALRVAQGASTYVLKASNASGETAFGRATGLNHVKVGDIEFPTDSDGGIWLEFRPSNPAAFIPAWKVLSGTDDPAEIAGKIVLVGTSAPGLNDLRASPLDAALPGVEIQAQAIEHILAGRFLSRPDYATALEIVFVLIVGAGLSIILPRISAGSAALLGGSVIILIFVGGWLAYRDLHILLDPSYPALALGLLVAAATLYVYRRVEMQRGQMRLAFAHYVAPTVVDELIAHPERLELGGEVRELTLLFCDVRNFTSISESMTAHELTQFINSLLTPLSDIILQRRGTIDKYMGDAIMAFWNAPLDDPEHAGNACAAGLAIAARMGDLNRVWESEAKEKGRAFKPVAVGIGINSGSCCVGNLGSSQRFDYSAIGDDVNVASRLEGLCKLYGVTIVVGESTAQQIGDPLVELDLMRVKGRTKPSRLYTMAGALGSSDVQLAELLPQHEALLHAYRDRNWDGAEAALAACRAFGVAALAKFYGLYEKRIGEFRHHPPPADWDGAFTATEK